MNLRPTFAYDFIIFGSREVRRALKGCVCVPSTELAFFYDWNDPNAFAKAQCRVSRDLAVDAVRKDPKCIAAFPQIEPYRLVLGPVTRLL
jgi:hypothetical protein